MRYSVNVLGFYLVMAMRFGAWAQGNQAVPALPVVPANGFSFVGTWSCEGTFRGGQRHQSTFTGEMILDGKWLEIREEDHVPSTGYKAKYLIGYNGMQKALVELDANTFGSATYTSGKGWQGNVLTMTSAMLSAGQASYAADRFLYTVTAGNTFTVDWQVSKTEALEWITRG